MRIIIVIIFSFIFFGLTAQNTDQNKNILKINIASTNLLDLYKQECKVTSKNSGSFYDLFCDELMDEEGNFIWEPLHVNDINPSTTFNEKIGVVDYKDQMKSISRYIVDLDIVEIGKVDFFNSDSGFVNLTVRKTVSSSKYNEPNYNIVNSGITERVDYSSSNLLSFKLKFYKDFNRFYCKIYDVSAFRNDLEREYIYKYNYNTLTSKKPKFLDLCGIKPDIYKYAEKDSLKFNKDYSDWIDCKKKFSAFGNKLLYTKSKSIDEERKIPGYKSPKKIINNSFVDLVYREKSPILIAAKYPMFTNFNFGTELIPSSFNYEENLSPSFSILLPINSKFSAGVKFNNTISSLFLNLDFYQTSFVTTDNSEMSYTRINTISNMVEEIEIKQNNVFISTQYLLNSKLSLLINYLALPFISVSSTRTANALYEGQYGEDLFNILISEDINNEDFGTRSLSKSDNLTFNTSQYFELGIGYTQKINSSIKLFASGLVRLKSQNLIEKSNTNISTTATEFNSILTNTEFLKISQLNINCGVSIKLL